MSSLSPSWGSGSRFLCATLSIFLLVPAAHSQELAKLPDLVERVAPSVVSISVVGGKFTGEKFTNEFGSSAKEQTSAKQPSKEDKAKEAETPKTGSGMIISADGYIVTVDYLVEDTAEITVTLADGTHLTADLVGVDNRSGIALLKVSAPTPLSEIRFADISRVRRGQPLIAMGSPYGLGGTVSLGIISAIGRDIGSGPYDYLQTDAVINRGNAGGPLFNFDGEVVGMASAIISSSGGNVGISFAIPSSVIKLIAEELRRSGSVPRAWLGVVIQNVTKDIATALGLKEDKGALITKVPDDGPAAKAGLKAEDAILELNGLKVEDARDLARKIADLKPDEMAELVIWRSGGKKTVSVRLGRLTTGKSQERAPKSQERAPVAATDAASAGLKLATSAEGGLVIVEVVTGSSAADKGLKTGDIVLEVAGTAIKTPDDLDELIAKNRSTGAILLKLRSGDSERYVALPLSPEASAPAAQLSEPDEAGGLGELE